MPELPGDRQQPRLDEVLLARLRGRSRSPCARAARTQSKLVAVRVIAGLRPGLRRSRGRGDAGEVAGDCFGDAVERKDLVGEAGLGDRAGHAPDDRGGLVLDDDGAAGGADLAGAVAPVGAHAGQDDGRGRRRRRRSTAERNSGSTAGRQKFSGGPWLRPVVQAARASARTTRWWSPGARCTVPGTQRAAVGGLHHPQRAEPVQPLGELAGEDRRHVLDEQHRHREGRRQLRAARGPGPRGRRWRSRSPGRRASCRGPVRGAAGARGERRRGGRRRAER